MGEQLTTFEIEWAGGRESPALQPTDSGGEALLVEALRAGEEWAYEALIQQFQQPVYNLVCRLLEDPRDACDVVQEIFLKVFRKIGSFRGDSSLRTWIYRITVNESHNHSRWTLRHRREELELDSEAESRTSPIYLVSSEDSPFDYVLDRERQQMLEKALASLSPALRSAVVLRDIEDLSYEEIADILKVPLGTVKSRILRGREALRRILDRQLEVRTEFQLSPQLVE